MAYDHVVGADPAVHRGWDGPYDVRTTFHEPMVMFGFLAALTSAGAGDGHHHPAGRDPAQLGMKGRISWRGDAGKLAQQAGRWQEAGATHLAVNTMGAGLASLGDHLGALEQAAVALGLRSS